MSNFNQAAPNASRSAISLGGEWRSRDTAEANKYKSLLGRKPKSKSSQSDGSMRPRSSPGVKVSNSSSTGRRTPPKSAPPGGKRCDRVNELEWEPSQRKNLEAHLPLKKTRSQGGTPELEKKQQYNLGPGMTMTRSKSRVAVTINTGLPDLPDPVPRKIFQRDPTPTPQGDPERDALIVQLQQQVCDLTLYLEEERLNHKSTKEKAVAAMKEKLNDLERRHMEELKDIQMEQEDQVEVIKELHKKEMTHLKTSSNTALARMKGELEFLQGAFEAYKGTLVQDMEEKWNKKELDMKLKFQEDTENALQELRQDLLEEKLKEKKQMGREYQKQIQLLQKEHKKEVDNMLIKFSSASADVANLKKALDQLKRVQDELDAATEKLATKDDLLRQTRMELADTRLRVTQYEEHFQTRVDEVDDKYKERIHNLMSENSELRRRYMQKADELFTEKSKTERKRVEKLMNTKEVMRMLVHVKNRNNINLACSDPDTDQQSRIPVTRPVSAPVSRVDKRLAFRGAGETKHLQSIESKMREALGPAPPRPKTVAAQRVQSDVMQSLASFSPFRTDSLQSL